MKSKRNVLAILTALACVAGLQANMSTTPLKAIQDTQRSQGRDGYQSTWMETRKNCVVQSVYAPALELVVVDESGAIHTETLSNTVIIRDGNDILAINDLEPGDSITLVQNSSGEVTKIAVVN